MALRNFKKTKQKKKRCTGRKYAQRESERKGKERKQAVFTE